MRPCVNRREPADERQRRENVEPEAARTHRRYHFEKRRCPTSSWRKVAPVQPERNPEGVATALPAALRNEQPFSGASPRLTEERHDLLLAYRLRARATS